MSDITYVLHGERLEFVVKRFGKIFWLNALTDIQSNQTKQGWSCTGFFVSLAFWGSLMARNPNRILWEMYESTFLFSN